MADAATAGPLTAMQVDMLSEATESALPLVLGKFGYRCPPPPPAGELVEDTVAALATALTADVDRPAMVKQARWHFLTMSMRIHRQLDQAQSIARTSVLRRCARRVGSTARVLVPAVVAAGLKALIETAAKDLGPVASQSLGTLAENGVILATARITSWWHDLVQGTAIPSAADPTDAPDPVITHLSALFVHLGPLGASAETADKMLKTGLAVPSEILEQIRARVASIARHVRRLDQLREDRHPDDLRLAVAGAALVDATATIQDLGCVFAAPEGAKPAVDRIGTAALRVKAALSAAGYACGDEPTTLTW
jgi:hypothetical protein